MKARLSHPALAGLQRESVFLYLTRLQNGRHAGDKARVEPCVGSEELSRPVSLPIEKGGFYGNAIHAQRSG